MATDTHSAPKPRRRAPRWLVVLAGAVVALVALAALVIAVVAPLSAGLPIGWGQYNNARYHLRIGTPPLWSVAADTRLYQSSLPGDCGFSVVASPPSERMAPSTLEAIKQPRYLAVYVTTPCGALGSNTTWAPPWRPSGQRVTVAGASAPVETNQEPGITQISYAVSVTLHGSIYTFQLQDPTADQARQDLPDFLTFVQSFRYTS